MLDDKEAVLSSSPLPSAADDAAGSGVLLNKDGADWCADEREKRPSRGMGDGGRSRAGTAAGDGGSGVALAGGPGVAGRGAV